MAAAIEGGGGGGGGTLSEVYHSAKKLLPRARDGIERLERLESTAAANGGLDSRELSFAVKKDISLLHSLSADVDRLSRSIPSEPQRDLWKRAQRKALDILNTVGRSNSVLRLIERRNRVDTWIKYLGMLLALVILYFLLR